MDAEAEAEAEGQMGAPVGRQSIFVGSQQSIGGLGGLDGLDGLDGLEGRPDIDAVEEGQMGAFTVEQSIRFGSQQGTEFCVGFALADPEKEGRRVYADVMEAEGHM
jgi:hypothetical protein